MSPSPRSRIEVVHGPAHSGKTAECIRRLRAAGDAALLIVPGTAHVGRVCEQLNQPTDGDVKKRVSTFGQLLKSLTRDKKAQEVGLSYRRALLAGIVQAEIRPNDYFGRMLDAPGFVAALADAIAELKLAGIDPAALTQAVADPAVAEEDPDLARKGSELARLYRRYMSSLRDTAHHDAEDLPRLACDHLLANPAALEPLRLLMVDGYYRIPASWRRLLRQIAAAGVQVVVTLPYEARRPLLFATTGRTLADLCREFDVAETALAANGADAPPALDHLERGLFAGETHRPAPFTMPDLPPVRFFDAPNPYTEVEMAARALCREHEENGLRWEECAVILRSLGNYRDLLSVVFDRYEIPYSIEQPRPVIENPFVKTVFSVLELFATDWQRDDLVRLLRSGYVVRQRGRHVRADIFRAKARRLGIRSGAVDWARAFPAASPDTESPIQRFVRIAAARSIALTDTDRDVARNVDELFTLVSELDMRAEPLPAGERRGPNGEWRVSSDEVAWRLAKRALGELSRQCRDGGGQPVTFTEFVDWVRATWSSAMFRPQGPTDCVAIIEPHNAGTLDVKLAVVMGMVERSFPRRITEDPFFRDDERALLARHAGVQLEPQSERTDDERLLFYMAATTPRQRLILSAPRSDDEADTLPSFYLDEVRALYDHVPATIRTLADVAPRPHECVGARDRLLACCAAEADGLEAPLVPAPDALQTVRASVLRPRAPAVQESGLRRAYAAPRRTSVTELETYNRCPFQHLVRFGLKLREQSDGATALDKGTLFHSVLRRHFRKHRDETIPADAEALAEALKEELDSGMGEATVDARPYRRAMMHRSLSDALEGFAAREVCYRERFGLRPAYFELAFGQPNGDDEEVSPEEPREYDDNSRPDPFVLPAEDGLPPVQFCGSIDRVDLTPEGQRALIMDYKVGNSVAFPHMKEGRSLQMPIYAMALESLWGITASVACYDSPRDQGRRRFFRTEHAEIRRFGLIPGVDAGGEMVKPVGTDEYEEMLRAARTSARMAAAGIQACQVVPKPGEHCAYCPYSDICRTERDGTHDGEPLPSQEAL